MQLISFNPKIKIEEACAKIIERSNSQYRTFAFKRDGVLVVARPFDALTAEKLVEEYHAEVRRRETSDELQTISINISAGDTITKACRDACQIAKAHDVQCSFDFNDVLVVAQPTSTPDELVQFYHNEMDRLRDEYEASDAYKESQEAAARAAEERNRRLGELLHHAPEKMTIADGKQEAWDKWRNNNTDPYGNAVVRYADMWARLMEGAIATGKNIEDVAKETSHDADTEGITGFMYGCAVRMLSDVWIHGEALRRWHNKDYGQQDSSGVVNPAVITIAPHTTQCPPHTHPN